MIIICGLAGISMSENDRIMDTRLASAGLLRGIASRGPDATGAAWWEEATDEIALTKVAVPVWRFLEARQERIPAATPTIILHTRFGTHGSSKDRRNNHPIVHGDIIGVHNGVLSNDNELFKKLGVERNGDVDSEAIFALLNQENAAATEVLGDIRGDAAVAWMDAREPEVLHLAKVTGRPLYLAQLKSGSLLFASTKDAVMAGVKALPGAEIEFQTEMKDEHYMKVRAGVILHYERIENVVPLGSSFSRQYDWTSGAATKTDKTPKPGEVGASFVASQPLREHENTPMWNDEDLKPTPTEASRKNVQKYLKQRSVEELERMAKNGSKWAKEELDSRVAVEFSS